MDVDFLHNHISVTSSQDIAAIANAPKKAGITLFDYVRLYADGSRICLSNRPEWLIHFYARDFHRLGLFEGNFDLYSENYALSIAMPHQEIYNDAKTYHNIGHSFSITKPSKNYCEFFYFAGSADNNSIVNFFLNNIDFLEKFIFYFKDKAAKIITTAEKSRLSFPLRSREVICNELSNLAMFNIMPPKIKYECGQELEIKKYYLNVDGTETTITKTEMQCLQELKKGKDSREIAEYLEKSQKTVENHIHNAKKKLSCNSKSELIKILKKSGYNFYQ